MAGFHIGQQVRIRDVPGTYKRFVGLETSIIDEAWECFEEYWLLDISQGGTTWGLEKRFAEKCLEPTP